MSRAWNRNQVKNLFTASCNFYNMLGDQKLSQGHWISSEIDSDTRSHEQWTKLI
uniref:Uncharacterized protein n=1 Tax=Rhizophora mucronata TaxID=61149 RepID=A0A2P2NBS5_RHIMU